MKIEKIPSPVCNKCGSTYVTVVKGELHCDDCSRITAGTSDYIISKKIDAEQLIYEIERGS